MERRVKERMVGAAILVAIVVLFVPQFLSGPAPGPSPVKSAILPAAARPEPMRTVRVDVNGNVESAAPAIEGAAPAPAPAPAPSAVSPAAGATPVVTSAAKAPPPATMPALEAAPSIKAGPGAGNAASAKTAPAAATVNSGRHGAWTVQLGSFESKANAEKLMKHWKSKGYPAFLSSVGAGAAMRHRVRMGPYADRAAALAAAARLKTSRQTASVVAPGH